MLGFLIALNLIAAWIREFTILKMVIVSNTNLHKAMAFTIMRAKVVFFNSNPIGRILTRFSKEMALLDSVFPYVLVFMSYGIFRTIGASISLALVNYWLFIPMFFMCFYFAYVARTASTAMIEAQKLDSVVRGPIHSLFAMVINGLISIRAFR